jgi:hypothetical protein
MRSVSELLQTWWALVPMLPHGGDAVHGDFPSASLVLCSPRSAIVSQEIAVMISMWPIALDALVILARKV